MNTTQIDLLARRLFDALKQVSGEIHMSAADHQVAYVAIDVMLTDLRVESREPDPKECEACGGSGRVRYQSITGSGAEIETECSECDGKGWV